MFSLHWWETLKDMSQTIASAFCWLTDEILLLRLGWSDLTDEEASLMLKLMGMIFVFVTTFFIMVAFFIIVCKGSQWSIFIHAATGHALNMRSFHPVQLVLSPITISSRRRMAVEEVSMRKLQETLGTTSLQCIHASHLALYFFGNRKRPWFCAIWVVPA